MKLNHIVLTCTLLLTGLAHAQLLTLDQYRTQYSVVNYDFSVTYDASGVMEPWIRDKGTYCPPGAAGACSPAVDLVVVNAPNALRSQGVLQFNGVNLARSAGPATKLYNACKNAGALSVEIELKNFETTLARSGFDLDDRSQPLRIVSFSRDLKYRNFTIGQFYDGGDQYQIGVRTATNESSLTDTKNPPDRLGNSFQDPLKSSTSAILVPSSARPGRVLQRVIFTLNKEGVGRLYLSDLDNNLYLATENSSGFGSQADATNMFKNWISGAYLNLGNENLLSSTLTNIAKSDGSPTDAAKNDFNTKSANGSNLAECGDACANEPNRYWKGEFNRVAIYCGEIPREVVLGSGTLNVIQNIVPAFPVDIAMASIPDVAIEKAQNIYTRLTGVKKPATEKVITDMADLIRANNFVAAAALATEDAQFVNTTIRDFAAKMSNRAETINVPLNDFTATFMGIARDNLPATEALTGDYFYMANRDVNVNPRTGLTGGGPYPTAPVPSRLVDDILRSNNHYESLETGRYDLNAVLVKTRQKVLLAKSTSSLQALDMPDPAGVLTSRQWLKEHAFAGTNRRLIEFSLREFLCTPIEMAADAGGADDVVGPDIDRLPGGDNSKYMSNCRSCHTILDSFRPAYAEWTFGKEFPKHVNFTDAITPDKDEDVEMGMKKDAKYPGVSFKYNKEADTDPTKVIYPDGRRTIDTKWVNHALTGSNKVNFQFPDEMVTGTGVNSFGRLLASSPKFSKCMAERAFRQICKRDVTSTDAVLINNAALAFSKNKAFNLKVLFQNIVIGDQCLGEAP